MEEAAKEAPKPTCPKCGVEISEFGQAQITLVNGLMCYMLWCGVETCRALFSCQIMGQAVRQQAPAPRIVVPSALPFNTTRKM